ncbi:hypothetical protein [Butyrivibrio fibrisolvens]|uniref:Uncharacterized protein n=1 Tax=Butyrivibrio fibrisolvens TaxID=831 RepID=A0A317G166_BUTFI|nr:hypothetical protein [Butyrivibrio fibrisolvens]PWT27207.1 hypothetical protein CPT75_08870 [Butyrivibrio fibrisolvens]
MNNSLKRAFLLRNICMLGSILLLFLVAVFFPHNNRYVIKGALCAGLIFYASVFFLQKYHDFIYEKKNRLNEIVDMYRWKKYCSKGEKNIYFNSLIWLGDNEGIDSYLQKNGLSLQQSISKHFYDIDRRLLYLGEDADYSHDLNRIKNMISLFNSLQGSGGLVSNRFSSYLQFYDYYIQKKYDLAFDILNKMESKNPLDQSWIMYHEMMVLKAQDQYSKAEAVKERLKGLKCNTRFHKWLEIEAPKQKTHICLPLCLLCLTLIVCLGFTIYKGTQKYSVVEDSLKAEYNIAVDDSKILYDQISGDEGIRIYAKGRNIIYIYYVNENGSYIITDVYKDKLNMPDTDYVTAMAASRVKAVSMMFYAKIPEQDSFVIVTESENLENKLLSGYEVQSVDSRTIDNETYYLIYARGDLK